MSFKFGFDKADASEWIDEPSEDAKTCKSIARELIPADESSLIEAYEDVQLGPGVILKKGLIRSSSALDILGEKELASSDLIAGKYEGGFKLWECGVDLAQHLCSIWAVSRDNPDSAVCGQGTQLKGLRALELGCGHGLPGLVAALAGMEVHFQDYNAEVLTQLTAPNYTANIGELNGQDALRSPRFFSGGWSSFKQLMTAHGLSGTYDLILSSDSIYSLSSQADLLDCIVEGLKIGGKALIAAKAYYFGVGGSAQGFKSAARARGGLTVADVRTIDDGSSNKREIFCLTRT